MLRKFSFLKVYPEIEIFRINSNFSRPISIVGQARKKKKKKRISLFPFSFDTWTPGGWYRSLHIPLEMFISAIINALLEDRGIDSISFVRERNCLQLLRYSSGMDETKQTFVRTNEIRFDSIRERRTGNPPSYQLCLFIYIVDIETTYSGF